MTITNDGYEVKNGIIRSPGRFEGEPTYAPYFYDATLNGEGDTDESEVTTFEINETDRKLFPELKDVKTIYLWQSDQGFVYTRTSPFKF